MQDKKPNNDTRSKVTEGKTRNQAEDYLLKDNYDYVPDLKTIEETEKELRKKYKVIFS